MTQQEVPLLNQFSKPASQPSVPPSQSASAAEVSLVDVAVILLRRCKLIALVTLAGTVLAAIGAFLLPPTYLAEATILPPQQQQSSIAALAAGAMGGLGAGVGSSLGLKNPGDMYVGILKSRTISDHIIARFHLQEVYKCQILSDARNILARKATFVAGKDALITIAVQDHDARRAADIANAYLEELHNQNSRLALTDASQRRLFFEQKLKDEKDALANAEIALKVTQQATGLLTPSGQSELLIRTGAQLRAEIAARTVQLEAMRSYATEENPQVRVLENEIAALHAQLRQVETSGSGAKLEMSGSRLPEAIVEYTRKLRDLKYHEALFELLAKQFEAARLDESKQAPVIQVVDNAITPDKDSRPRRLLVAFAAFACLVLTCLLVLWFDRARPPAALRA